MIAVPRIDGATIGKERLSHFRTILSGKDGRLEKAAPAKFTSSRNANKPAIAGSGKSRFTAAILTYDKASETSKRGGSFPIWAEPQGIPPPSVFHDRRGPAIMERL
jgi:hypothetical protein